jgi:hypothetical protein
MFAGYTSPPTWQPAYRGIVTPGVPPYPLNCDPPVFGTHCTDVNYVRSGEMNLLLVPPA